MENYNSYIPKDSTVRSTELKTIGEGTKFEHTCFFIHYTDDTVPSDCSKYRVLQIVISAAEGWQGVPITSYKDVA